MVALKPTAPEPPVSLRTMIGTPQLSWAAAANWRAVPSALPPAAKGTMRLIGREGKVPESSADSASPAHPAIRAADNRTPVIAANRRRGARGITVLRISTMRRPC